MNAENVECAPPEREETGQGMLAATAATRLANVFNSRGDTLIHSFTIIGHDTPNSKFPPHCWSFLGESGKRTQEYQRRMQQQQSKALAEIRRNFEQEKVDVDQELWHRRLVPTM